MPLNLFKNKNNVPGGQKQEVPIASPTNKPGKLANIKNAISQGLNSLGGVGGVMSTAGNLLSSFGVPVVGGVLNTVGSLLPSGQQNPNGMNPNPMDPNAPPGTGTDPNQTQEQPKGFLGKLKNVGKSLLTANAGTFGGGMGMGAGQAYIPVVMPVPYRGGF